MSAWPEKGLQKMVQSCMQLIQMINWKSNYLWSLVVLILFNVKNGDCYLIFAWLLDSNTNTTTPCFYFHLIVANFGEFLCGIDNVKCQVPILWLTKMIHKYTAHVHEPQITGIVLKIIVRLGLRFYLTSDSHVPKIVLFICFNKSSVKIMKNALYFILKALFVLKIFKTLSWNFGHVEEMAWLER